MKFKFKATKQDWLIFVLFAIILLFVIAVLVSNIASIAAGEGFAGLNPFIGLFKYFGAVIVFYGFALAFLFVTVKNFFFDREEGVGISIGPKDSKGFAQ